MRMVFSVGVRKWTEKVLDEAKAPDRLGSFYYRDTPGYDFSEQERESDEVRSRITTKSRRYRKAGTG